MAAISISGLLLYGAILLTNTSRTYLRIITTAFAKLFERLGVGSDVRIGDVWSWQGMPVERNREKGTRLYLVVGANDSYEAGPDSWVMQLVDESTLAPLSGAFTVAYMHAKSRLRGDWYLVVRAGFWVNCANRDARS